VYDESVAAFRRPTEGNMSRPLQIKQFLALILVVAASGCLPSSSGKSGESSQSTAAVETGEVEKAPTPPGSPPGNPTANLPVNPPANPPAKTTAKTTDPLRLRVEAALASVHNRDLLINNSFWTVFHGILGMGPNTELKDPETGKKYNALDYVFSETGANIRGLVFSPTDRGLDVQTVGINPFGKEHEAQGHQDQFLAEMIQWAVPANRPVKIAAYPNRKFTLQDFVEESKARCRIDSNQELGWCLIVVADYGGGTEATWTNRANQKLKFEQLLDYEMNQDMDVAACGGTHRLFGLAWAYHRHMAHCQKANKKPTEIWNRTKEFLEKYKDLSRKWQSSDGDFSTAHYRREEHLNDTEPRLAASGHIFEWLAQYVTDEEIRSTWMENGAKAVAQIILDSERQPVASGSLYHAAHGLATYHTRRYNPKNEPAVAGK